ncbi:UNVERIFIED_CONTAM: Histone transcription regulator 3 [Siphonaria sp. JEL0065]|nr:Histone transcription regulator 3 [Siphonaria sp. JEL0065]
MFTVLNATRKKRCATPTKEASKEKLVQTSLEVFRRVQRTQRSGGNVADEYASLLANAVLNEPLKEVANIHDSQIHALQYVVHLNYADFVEKENPRLAKCHYEKATQVDPSSTSAWIKLGSTALKTLDYTLACRAFESALKMCQNKIDHWYSLKGLSEASFAVGDFATCLSTINLLLSLNPSYEPAISMRYQLNNEASISSRPKKPFEPLTLPTQTLSLTCLCWKEYGDLLVSFLKSDAIDTIDEDEGNIFVDKEGVKLAYPISIVVNTPPASPIAVDSPPSSRRVSSSLALIDSVDSVKSVESVGTAESMGAGAASVQDADEDLEMADRSGKEASNTAVNPSVVADDATEMDVVEGSLADATNNQYCSHQPEEEPKSGGDEEDVVNPETDIKEDDEESKGKTSDPPSPDTTKKPSTKTTASPAKRKRRFQDLEARVSKRKKGDKAPTTPVQEIELEHDLVSDADFYSTLQDDILPTTGDFRTICFGEETIFPKGKNRQSPENAVVVVVLEGEEEEEVDLSIALSTFEARLIAVKTAGESAIKTVKEDQEIGERIGVGIIRSESNESLANPFYQQDELREYLDTHLKSGNRCITELAQEFLFRMMIAETDGPSAVNRFREHSWPAGMRKTVVTLVCEMEANNFGTAVVGKDGVTRVTFELVLSVCELLFDFVLEEKVSAAPDSALIDRITFVLESWWALISQAIALTPQVFNLMDSEWLLRKYWLQAQMSEHFNQLINAVEMYKKCLEVSLQQSIDPISLPNCRCNSKINKETIKQRLQSLSLEKYLRSAEYDFGIDTFKSVIDKLHPLLFQDNTFPAWFSSILFPGDDLRSGGGAFLTTALVLELPVCQRIRILKMLVKSYEAMEGMATEAFLSRLFLVCCCVKDLGSGVEGRDLLGQIEQLSMLMKGLLNTLALNEGEDEILKDHNAMLPILDFMGYQSTSAVLPDCIASIFATVRLAWTIVKQCGFARYRNDNVLVNFVIRSWSLMYYACKTLETRKDKHVALDWTFFAHSQLGEVGICDRDDAFLINLVIRRCLAKKGGESMSELYQCFCCMYGIVNTVDPDYALLEHNSQLRELDAPAAAQVFAPLSLFVMDKLATRNIKAITNDIRDTIESISEHFSEPPWKVAEVAFNKALIDKFLASGIQGKQTRPLGTVQLVPEKTQYLEVYKSLFYIRGKFACLQRRAVIGIKTKKSFESLEVALKEFLFNLYVNTFSVNAWLTAADVYCSLSYEYLTWNANDIISNLELIRDYQRKSFHCYEQAQALLRHREFTVFNDGQLETEATLSEQTMFAFGNFGYLCYSMIVAPMNCLAIKSDELKGLTVWKSRFDELSAPATIDPAGESMEVVSGESFGKSILLNRGMEAFKMAAKKDPSDWRYPFMLGKLAIISGLDAAIVLSFFEKAIPLVPEDSGTKEQEHILDVQYCMVSYLCKGLSTGKLEPSYVITCLDRTSMNKDGSFTAVEVVNCESETMEAYEKVLRELTYMKRVDKKKWQHRPYWKAYWIYKNIFNDVEKAKAELLNIFQLRSNARTFINFWKAEFERPGRHYIYIHKYTMALISSLRENNDLESLRHLVRKTQKAYDVLLYPQAIWRAGFEAMNDLLSEKVKEITWVQFVKTIPQKEFLANAPAIEKKMLWGNGEEKTEDAGFLHTAFHLKRLNENMEDETVLSRILVLLYCKLFLANIDVVAPIEENETLTEDSSAYFTLVLRRCLVACKIPWNKRIIAEETQETGTVVGENVVATPSAVNGAAVNEEHTQATEKIQDAENEVAASTDPIPNMIKGGPSEAASMNSPIKNLEIPAAALPGVADVELLNSLPFESIFNVDMFMKEPELEGGNGEEEAD